MRTLCMLWLNASVDVDAGVCANANGDMGQPYSARYDAGKHQAIVLDETSAELVGRCTVSLQAGIDGF